MKLLNLRFSNLNSLYGEWAIDFEHREYVTHGIFAITGPTGAGKSTLLDAISLALYGRTPRLGTISTSANEIMSRDCGTCFAEVTFQSHKGIFRAHWSQRRARSKADGNLQAPQHELIDASTQQVVTAKKTETLAIIQESVGLDYEQFMRSIMLAQGEFATFLKSEDSKRAAILAKITGTDIYARIGTAVFQRFRSESAALESIASQSSAIELLSEQSILELTARIEEINSTLEKRHETRKSLAISIHWLERLEELDRDLVCLKEQRDGAELAVQAASSIRGRLEKAQRASRLRQSLESLVTLQSRTASAEKLLQQTQAEFAEVETAKAQLMTELQASKQAIDQTQSAIEASRPVWRAMHELDLRIVNTQATLEKAVTQYHAVASKQQRLGQEKVELDRRLKQTASKLERIHDYRLAKQYDADLTQLLPKIEHLAAEYLAKSGLHTELELKLAAISNIESQAITERSVAEDRLVVAELAVLEKQNEIDERDGHRQSLLEGRSVDALQAKAKENRDTQQAMLEHVRAIEGILGLEREHTSKSQEKLDLEQTFSKNCQARVSLERQISQQKELISALEHSFLKDQLIASLQEQRSRLVEGQPCELCGSTHHPWSEARTMPSIGESEQALNRAKVELARLMTDLDEAIRVCDRNTDLLLQTQQTLNRLTDSLSIARAEFIEQASRHQFDPSISESSLESSRQSLDQLKTQEVALTTQLRKANSLLEAIARGRDELAQLITERASAEQSIQSIANNIQNISDSRQRLTTELFKHQDIFNSIRQKLVEIFESVQQPFSEVQLNLGELRERAAAWQASEEELNRFEKERATLNGSIVSLVAQIDQVNQDLAAAQDVVDLESESLESLVGDRKDRYGNQDPQQLEDKLQATLDQHKTQSQKLTQELEPKLANWHALDRQILLIQSSLSTDVEHLLEQEKSLEVDLQLAGFTDLLDLESSIKPQSEIDGWLQQLNTLEEASKAAAVRLAQKEREREDWKAKELSEVSSDVLRQQLSDVDCSIEGLSQERLELQHRLSHNQAKLVQFEEARSQLANQQGRVDRWSVLNELIGSADGTKFRRFAQGITFELLLAYANTQLMKLTDRYLLKKGDEGLGVVVIDHYQSSRSRSAANLSGGETFLVSLALALGLSKLASRNVQIDSLFLDEGFGTLDEETLEEALHTLSNLRQEGKLVGLISHVAALKEQIPVRIEVVKGPMGRSRLVGPGVK